MIQVFTDGACSNNGKGNAKAGLGVYFTENDPRNASKRIIGRQTNNVAELSAIIEVFTILSEEIELGEEIIIYSDSKIAMGWCTTTGQKYERGDWKKSSGEIPNVDLIKIGYGLCKANSNIKLAHIRAHTGLTDELSLGNEGADRLANEAIGCKSCPYDKKQKQKYYLKIPYSEKEIGKKYGTKWDPKKKKWYYEGLNTDDNFKTLMNLFHL
jgi:ribonuclease HI